MHSRSIAPTFLAFAFVALAALPLHAEETAPAADAAAPSAPAAKPAGPAGPAGPSAKKPAAKAPAAKGIQLSRSAALAQGIDVHPEVLSECMIQTKLPQLIADHASSVTLVDKAGGPNRLELKIVDIHAPNGGMFSGPKWLVVEGRLFSGGAQKGNFTVRESSMASATACGMLDKVMRVMAVDIADWIAHPTKNATLVHKDEDDDDK